MKKIVLFFIIFFIVVFITGLIGVKVMKLDLNPFSEKEKPITALRVEDGKILNDRNEEVLLKGISSHGVQWFPELLTETNFTYLKDNFKINTFRLAVYVNDDYDYEIIKDKLYYSIDTLTNLNMYVVIDWHVLEHGDPNVDKEKAKLFFDDLSKKYSNNNNIIYEICNEPNGNKVSWDDNIKPYAEEIIPVIRNNSPKSLIVVGTPTFSKRIDKASENPLDFENIVYAVHFYSGFDGDYLRDKIKEARELNIPVLITEWGTTNETGDGSIYEKESKEWIDFLNDNNIGYINWSFCNKDEGSAILKTEYNKDVEIDKMDDFLTNSGNLVKELYNK